MAVVTVTIHSTRIDDGPPRATRGGSMVMVALLGQYQETIAAQAVPADGDLRNVSFPNMTAMVTGVIVTTGQRVFTEMFQTPYRIENGTFTVDVSLETRF